MSKKQKDFIFEDWFTITIPDTWEYAIEEDLLTICKTYNGKGVIQTSFFGRDDSEESLQETAENHLNRFLNQYDVTVEDGTYKIIEAPGYTIANASGECDEEFIKVWVFVNKEKMLLVTYISSIKTRELSTAENIVYSIQFI